MRPGEPKPGEKPFLVARLGLNRKALFDTAVGAAGCLKFGSGGLLPALSQGRIAVDSDLGGYAIPQADRG